MLLISERKRRIFFVTVKDPSTSLRFAQDDIRGGCASLRMTLGGLRFAQDDKKKVNFSAVSAWLLVPLLFIIVFQRFGLF